MKLSEVHPCDRCDGPLGQHFQVVRVTQAFLTPKAQATVGMAMILGGHLGLAEVMSPSADEAILVCGEKDARLWTELLICDECHYGFRAMCLAELTEKVNARKEQADAVDP